MPASRARSAPSSGSSWPRVCAPSERNRIETRPRVGFDGAAVTDARLPLPPPTASWPSRTASASASPIAVPPKLGYHWMVSSALRTRHPDAQCGEREQEQYERDVLAPDASAHNAGQDVHVREPDRVAHAPPLGEHVERNRERDEQQGDEEERALEGHEPPPQTAPTCTIARTPATAAPARTRTSTRLPRELRDALTLCTSAPLGADPV